MPCSESGQFLVQQVASWSDLHLRECEEKEIAATKGVDCPEGREGKNEVDKSKSERREQRGEGRGTSFLENR